MHHLSDYDYELPVDRIAQTPAAQRDASRLLVMERATGRLRDRRFFQLAEELAAGDLLVFNDTRVLPARLLGRRATGGCVEILLLGPAARQLRQPGRLTYRALIKPLGRLKEGEKIFLDKGLFCRLLDPKNRIVDFGGRSAEYVMKKTGILPLPPYVRRPPQEEDKTRYQTIFARHPGAVAAPTAGLHFTRGVLKTLKAKGVGTAFLTLHVGYALFLRSAPAISAVMRFMRRILYSGGDGESDPAYQGDRRGRVIAVGTTVVRALEDAAAEILREGRAVDIRRSSRLFIYPPYTFRVVNGVDHNFHLPRTSLLMLVAAFGGLGAVREAYRHAIESSYRFYSYGDAMLII
jgi:S-adenosylmethionine:tRNA ribosyltransferase-isomerase